jgi:beta propeller repeat protein
MNQSEQSHPKIFNDKIIWTDNRNGISEIFLYWIGNGTHKQITNNNFTDFSVDFHDDIVLYNSYEDGYS